MNGIDIEKYEKKLQNYYDENGLLIQYPTKRPMRVIALEKIAKTLDAEKKYTEKQINEVIINSISFSDIELIRRELFQYGMIDRLRDGSQYWLDSNWDKVVSKWNQCEMCNTKDLCIKI